MLEILEASDDLAKILHERGAGVLATQGFCSVINGARTMSKL